MFTEKETYTVYRGTPPDIDCEIDWDANKQNWDENELEWEEVAFIKCKPYQGLYEGKAYVDAVYGQSEEDSIMLVVETLHEDCIESQTYSNRGCCFTNPQTREHYFWGFVRNDYDEEIENWGNA